MSELGFPEVDAPEASGSRCSRHAPRDRLRGAPKPRVRQVSQPEDDAVAITAASVAVAAPVVKHRPGSFPALGLLPEVCAAMSKRGYGFPTPIQRRVIPAVLAGRDVVAMARTGSGKTASFLAPLLQRISQRPISSSTAAVRNGPRALIIAPTRELALQTLRFCGAYGRGLEPRVRATCVVGGTALETQFEALAVCPEVVIATPGRLLQILAEMGMKGGLTLSCVETLVLDEADRLFEGTLAPETRALIDAMAPEEIKVDRQTVLVSATMPRALADFTHSCLRPNVQVVRLDVDKAISPTLAVGFALTRSGDEKAAALVTVVRQVMNSGAKRSVVVFVATHRGVEYIVSLLRAMVPVESEEHKGIVSVHGSMDQAARVEAVHSFRKRLARVLVVTDVAARGIDLPELDVVVNFDMAAAPKLFVHRVGRAGRAGRPGMALSLISADEVAYMIDTLLFLGRGVSLAKRGAADASVSDGDYWDNHALAMESSFLIGAMPSLSVEDDSDSLTKLIRQNIEIEKLRKSSLNAHGLYVKTRVLASGESVKRAKKLYADGNGEMAASAVHPWFFNMESEKDRSARDYASKLASWRPKELAVSAPRALKRRRVEEDGDGLADDDAESEESEGSSSSDEGNMSEDNSCTEDEVHVAKKQKLCKKSRQAAEKLKVIHANDVFVSQTHKKKSSRQLAMEEQRSEFYVPLRRNDNDVRDEQALKLGRGGSMADTDGLKAFRAVQDARMDMVADTNTDMLREKRKGKNDMFWDRVSKKFIKGGVTSKTSKQNTHVATREAKARSGNQNTSYGTADGSMFKKWLGKNQKVVDQMREAGSVGGQYGGIGSNDFRKGAFGRRSRIAAIGARQRAGESEGTSKHSGKSGGFRSARSEIKSVPQIKKERKMKQKAEARRMAKSKGKGRQGGPVMPRPDKRRGLPSRSKTLIYKKGGK